MLQADRNCLDGWLQVSNVHFKVGERCVIQVIHWGPESRLCLGLKKDSEPLKTRANTEALTAVILQKGQCGLCMYKEIPGRNHKLSCLRSPRY